MDWITSFLIAIALIATTVLLYKTLDYIENKFSTEIALRIAMAMIILWITFIIHNAEIVEAHTATQTATVKLTAQNYDTTRALFKSEGEFINYITQL